MAKKLTRNKATTKPSPKPAKKAQSKPVKPTKTPVSAKQSRPLVKKPAPAPTPQPKPELVNSVPPARPTDGKPRKNLAGFVKRELDHYRDLLLAKRREIVGDMSQMEREALRAAGGSNLSNLPLHMADMGTDNYEQEFTLGLVEKDRQLLREINNALIKLIDGRYGICEGTGKPISKARLEAQPWARFSIEYARQKEQGFRRFPQ